MSDGVFGGEGRGRGMKCLKCGKEVEEGKPWYSCQWCGLEWHAWGGEVMQYCESNQWKIVPDWCLLVLGEEEV